MLVNKQTVTRVANQRLFKINNYDGFSLSDFYIF